MANHALLSASGASRWLACTPSARLEEMIPQKSSKYAEEGTFAHKLAELETRSAVGLISPTTHAKRIRELKEDPLYNLEMHEHAREYAEFIKESFNHIRKTCPDALVELEVRVDFSHIVPGGFGTCDCAIIADRLLSIIDFKYGKGYRVDAEDNPQMMLYAIGALQQYEGLYDINVVEMTIFQPRLHDGITTNQKQIGELFAWGKYVVKPRALLADAGTGEFAPSDDTCKFCRAKGQCKARAEKYLDLFDDCPDPMLLTVEEAAEYLKRADGLTAWFKDLNNLVTEALFNGQPVPDWKLVEGRSIRKITNEPDAVAALTSAGVSNEDIYNLKLKGITALEKTLGKKRFTELLTPFIEKPAGKPTLVPASDKRLEYHPDKALIDMFNNDEEEE